ncbi:hypothetical protein U3516DRAFT_734710 [Neocallimastix sp. 'constans']
MTTQNPPESEKSSHGKTTSAREFDHSKKSSAIEINFQTFSARNNIETLRNLYYQKFDHTNISGNCMGKSLVKEINSQSLTLKEKPQKKATLRIFIRKNLAMERHLLSGKFYTIEINSQKEKPQPEIRQKPFEIILPEIRPKKINFQALGKKQPFGKLFRKTLAKDILNI